LLAPGPGGVAPRKTLRFKAIQGLIFC